MRLYSGTSSQFVEDTLLNQIGEKLKVAYETYFQYGPSPSEMRSWRNSLRALSDVVQYSKLLDHGVILEYQLPLSSLRLDCILSGRDKDQSDRAVIIELKQWDKIEDGTGENEIVTWLGGSKREVLHPSVQVARYKSYLQDLHTAFYEGPRPIGLDACAYMHNYSHDSDEVVYSMKFGDALRECPLFTADDVNKLKSFLTTRLEMGHGMEVLKRIEKSKYRPSRKLMDHVADVIKGKSEYVLLDEQQVVYDTVFAWARHGFHDKRKIVIIVKGGPGTGKSVIALNLMADLLRNGYNSHYVTGSRAFTQTLRKIVGTRGAVQFKFTHNYTETELNEVDVLICDEAHRIRESSSTWLTPKHKRKDTIQIEELIHASKVSVYFIDDHQIVRPNEIGSVEYIRKFAQKNDCRIFEYELQAQFRCSGSSAFVNWLDNMLEIRRTSNVYWTPDGSFDFRIFDSPEALEKEIRTKISQGFTARVTAGFCWPWSKPNKDGTLKDDVVIGEFRRPWNASPDARKLAPGIPKANLWAYDPRGMNQIGCIYTAQGFEFDYVGVIMGSDLTYDPAMETWQAHPENSYDRVVKQSRGKYLTLVKDAYRVLLSRGMKGCYVYFLNAQTEKYFRSRIKT